jgi:hypothetical protein
MAKFGWAYIDCNSAESGSEGPNGSLQFSYDDTGRTTGSAYLTFFTASGVQSYLPNSLILSGNMYVTGTISASTFHTKDITTIDATGSTTFGDDDSDIHMRTGSLVVENDAADIILSASTVYQTTFVRGFAGRYVKVTDTSYNAKFYDYIIGVSGSGNVTINLPSGSLAGTGSLMIIKDEYLNRDETSGARIYISASIPAGKFTIDAEPYYVLSGTMPAVNLYTDGVNWFVF